MITTPMISENVEKFIQILNRNRPEGHDLWVENKLNCSPAETDRVGKIKDNGIDSLNIADIDFLVFNAATTIGSETTFHYFLPEFFRAFFDKRQISYSTDVGHVFEKLERIDFETWPKDSQIAALELCLLGSGLEQEEHMDFFETPDTDIELLTGKIKNRLKQISGAGL